MSSPASALARHRLFSPTAGIRVSPLCLGTMTFGEAHSERNGKCSKETTFAILDSFFKNGGNFLDTANVSVLVAAGPWTFLYPSLTSRAWP